MKFEVGKKIYAISEDDRDNTKLLTQLGTISAMDAVLNNWDRLPAVCVRVCVCVCVPVSVSVSVSVNENVCD